MAMDKAQKQLIDSYFRKRKIANDAGGLSYKSQLKNHELKYFLRNGMMSINDIGHNLQKFSFISDNPEMLNIKNVIDGVDNRMLSQLIRSDKKIFNYISPERLATFDNNNLQVILPTNPQFIKYFDKSKFNQHVISDIIFHNPKDADKYIDLLGLEKFDGATIASWLSNRPEWIDKFDLNKLSDGQLDALMNTQPELKPILSKYYKNG